MAKFAERLMEIRKERKMTQAEVAEQLNVSFQAVSLWERGETMPDIEKVPEIAKLFKVTTDWLLMETEATAEKNLNQLVLDIQESLSDRLFDENRMYTYVKTYATMKHLPQTLKVLPYARQLHEGQYRKGKDQVPYIYHPLLLACHALALGLDEDNLVSAALLHDVCEDCGVEVQDLPVNEETKEVVALLTKDPSPEGKTAAGKDKYYAGIAANGTATMVKLLDRCNNVSGMAAGFDKKKLVKYIRETEKRFYPLLQQAKTDYPQYSNQIFLIKYHMSSVLEAIKHQL